MLMWQPGGTHVTYIHPQPDREGRLCRGQSAAYEPFSQGPVKVIVAGLEAGMKIPVHPEGLSTFHFMQGKGVMIVDGERLPVGPGTVIIADHGTPRGMEAETRLTFIAVRITDLTT